MEDIIWHFFSARVTLVSLCYSILMQQTNSERIFEIDPVVLEFLRNKHPKIQHSFLSNISIVFIITQTDALENNGERWYENKEEQILRGDACFAKLFVDPKQVLFQRYC